MGSSFWMSIHEGCPEMQVFLSSSSLSLRRRALLIFCFSIDSCTSLRTHAPYHSLSTPLRPPLTPQMRSFYPSHALQSTHRAFPERRLRSVYPDHRLHRTHSPPSAPCASKHAACLTPSKQYAPSSNLNRCSAPGRVYAGAHTPVHARCPSTLI